MAGSRAVLALALLSFFLPAANAAVSRGYRVPSQFEVSVYADEELLDGVLSMTLDSSGRVVVAGEGYVKILEDTNVDGKADRAILYSEFPKGGAHGLCFDGPILLAVGDDGVWRLRDTDGDGKADGEPQLILQDARQGGNSANGIVRGPDGAFYLAGGNDAGINESHITMPTSPVKDAVTAGAIVRISPDGKTSEVIADGFRNPYDLAFTWKGDLFTMDSDGNTDRNLPWHSPNRLMEVSEGMNHGWSLPGWKHNWNGPDYWLDLAPRLAETPEGSPTGMLAVRHRAFAPYYQHGVFSLDWSKGRVYFFPLERDSDFGFTTDMEIFMEADGKTEFSPVDMAVNPAGSLFIATGGRGKKSRVLRVSWRGNVEVAEPERDILDRVINADQPLASWSRAGWESLARSVRPAKLEQIVRDQRASVRDRIRALEVLVDVHGGIDVNLALKVDLHTLPELSARGIWALSMSKEDPKNVAFFAEKTHSRNPLIARAGWIALARQTQPFVGLDPAPNWLEGMDSKDRRVRAASILAAQGPGFVSFQQTLNFIRFPKKSRQQVSFLLVFGASKGPADTPAETDWRTYFIDRCLDIIASNVSDSVRLDAARLLQLGLGGLKLTPGEPNLADGYAAVLPEFLDKPARVAASQTLANEFPTRETNLNLELSRCLAMLKTETPDLLDRVASRWSDGADVGQDIHYLLVAAQLPGERGDYVTYKCAHSLALLHHKLAFRNETPGAAWSSRVDAVWQALAKADPNLAAALVADNAFGRAEHVMFARSMQGDNKLDAIRKLAKKAERRVKLRTGTWSPELIEMIGELPPEESELWQKSIEQSAQSSDGEQ